jgi:hypothetical protein
MDTAHNFLKKFKLYDVCSDDGMENLEYVHFINGYAYASDAHIIVRVPLSVCTSFSEDEYKKLNGYSIHFSLLKMLMQFEVVNIDEGIDLDDKGETFNYIELTATRGENDVKVVLRRYEDRDKNLIQAPNFEGVIQRGRENEVPVSSIGFRIKLLKTLSAAMGQEIIFLRFTKANGYIYVIPEDETIAGTIGIIMPVIRDIELPFED